MMNRSKTVQLFELKKNPTNIPVLAITRSELANDFFRKIYSDDIEVFESVYCLFLNRKMQTVGYAKLSQGGICGALVDVRLIAKYAIDCLASTVVLCHNHPTGDTKPSTDDNRMTAKVKTALQTLDITLSDHIILGEENQYYSYADSGNL